MKKFIWISFALLASFWTILVVISVQIVNWSFSLISTSQVGEVVNGGMNLQVPLWLTPWIDQSTISKFEASATYLAQWIDSLLPNSVYLGDFLNILIWLSWALIVFIMLVIAATAHWVANRHLKARTQ